LVRPITRADDDTHRRLLDRVGTPECTKGGRFGSSLPECAGGLAVEKRAKRRNRQHTTRWGVATEIHRGYEQLSDDGVGVEHDDEEILVLIFEWDVD
jgi:hypothetical protein